MSISATIDPAGVGGGACSETLTSDRQSHYGTFTWETMPEQLSAAGVSWKVYNDPTALLELSPFPYFKTFWEPDSTAQAAMAAQALVPTYPASFDADVVAGTLPAVSWIMPNPAECEHPAAPPEYGEYLVQQILNTLVSNPDVWSRTVFFIMYDENGGFFDHVPPPVPTSGAAGAWLTVDPLPSEASGIAGPIGLGFRVPCLVVSPFSRGGYRCSKVLDHASILRFLETRFGVAVPSLSLATLRDRRHDQCPQFCRPAQYFGAKAAGDIVGGYQGGRTGRHQRLGWNRRCGRDLPAAGPKHHAGASHHAQTP
jgi:phospholipase C